MKTRVPDYFQKFKCIASECEDTCCAGWEIVIDDESYQKYQKVEGKFGERLRSEIRKDGDENIFKSKGNDCAFLNGNKLCDLYTELGEEGLCYTCTQYPRYTEEFGSLREVGISLSCPEAARIILGSDRAVDFKVTDNPDEMPGYNDIDGMMFLYLLQCRSIVFRILQMEEMPLKVRAGVVLAFTDEVQEKIDEDLIDEIKDVKEKYSNQDFILKTGEELGEYIGEEDSKYHNIKEYFNVFKGLKHINPNDPLGLDDVLRCYWNSPEDKELYLKKHREFKEYYKDQNYKFKNVLVYFIFRYYMKGVFDYDLLAKVKTALVSIVMMEELMMYRWLENGELTDADAVDIMHMYSKDVEHLEENVEKLAELFETVEEFKVEEILKVIMNG